MEEGPGDEQYAALSGRACHMRSVGQASPAVQAPRRRATPTTSKTGRGTSRHQVRRRGAQVGVPHDVEPEAETLPQADHRALHRVQGQQRCSMGWMGGGHLKR